MMRPANALKRPVKMLEQQWPWLVFAIVTTLFLAAIVAFVSTGALADIDAFYFSANVRGYTATGITLGLLAVMLTAMTFLYSARKRSAKGSSTMMTWLWLHVYLGSLAVICALLHAGFGAFSAAFTTGKVLLFVFLAIGFSGFLWRLAYAWVPKMAAPKIGNYSKLGSEKRAEAQETELEKLSAGKSDEFHRMKQWLLDGRRSDGEVARAAQQIRPEEQAAWAEVARVAQARWRALGRVDLQARYTRWLQGWRVLHVPMTFVFVVALVVHVLGAFDVPQKVTPLGLVEDGPFAVFQPASECKDCHAQIYEQWSHSVHARALKTPTMIIQTNEDDKTTLAGVPSPDPKLFCVTCHAPAGAGLTQSPTLPFPGESTNDGITCVDCHQHEGDIEPGSGGFQSKYLAQMGTSRTYYGPFTDPVGNAFHKSAPSAIMTKEPEKTCSACHTVEFDKNNDGQIQKGIDLVLQTTFDEYKDYAGKGGSGTCISCHMPVVPGATRAADNALLLFEQDYTAPPREVHDHGFIGIDSPLEVDAAHDPQKKQRDALLRTSARIELDGAPVVEADKILLKVKMINTSGHNLPTGFAFARQPWLEVIAKDEAGNVFFQSGHVAKSTDDLCDASTFGEASNPLRSQIQGCTAVDDQLVNIQAKLVDKIAIAADAQGVLKKNAEGEFVVIQAKDGHETYLQFLTGGPTVRVRPATPNESVAPLKVNEERRFSYTIPNVKRAGKGTISVRMLFRSLPPYFLRAMAAGAVPGEPTKLAPLVQNLQIVEIASLKATF